MPRNAPTSIINVRLTLGERRLVDSAASLCTRDGGRKVSLSAFVRQVLVDGARRILDAEITQLVDGARRDIVVGVTTPVTPAVTAAAQAPAPKPPAAAPKPPSEWSKKKLLADERTDQDVLAWLASVVAADVKTSGIRYGAGRLRVNPSLAWASWASVTAVAHHTLNAFGRSLKRLAVKSGFTESRLQVDGRRLDFYNIDPARVAAAADAITPGRGRRVLALVEAPVLPDLPASEQGIVVGQ